MKVWKVTYSDAELGMQWAWFATKREAQKFVSDTAETDKTESFTVKPVEVPARKAALIAWLNANAPDGNG